MNRDWWLTEDTEFCRERSCGPSPSKRAVTETESGWQLNWASHRSTSRSVTDAVANDRSFAIDRSKVFVWPPRLHSASPMSPVAGLYVLAHWLTHSSGCRAPFAVAAWLWKLSSVWRNVS